MFVTIVHQSIEDREDPNYVEENGPFKATSAKSYLGFGYYFWDDHIELAHWWGETRYNNNYIICEGDFSIEYKDFFDLVGCRKHQKELQSIAKKLNMESHSVGKIIEFLKDLEKKPQYKGIFPYKAIRAVDSHSSRFKATNYVFDADKFKFINLSPKLFICIFEKSNLILQSYNIVYPDKYL